MLVRVTFLSPRDSDVRYLQRERVPKEGTRVLNHGKRWTVTEVDADTAGGYRVRLRRTKTPAQ